MEKESAGEGPDAEAQSLFDLIFPKDMRAQIGLSDAEAGVIYKMWKNSPPGAQQFAVPAETDRGIVSSLKTKGYVAGFGNGIELTEKGKKVIVEMVTHEPNSFEKHAAEVSYNTIKAQTSKRPRQAFIKKQASKEPKSFNLKRVSLKKMEGNDADND